MSESRRAKERKAKIREHRREQAERIRAANIAAGRDPYFGVTLAERARMMEADSRPEAPPT